MAKLVSNVYGEALFELAMESNRLDDFYEESGLLLQVLADNPEFVQMMNHPKITKEEKLQLLEDVLKNRISDEMLELLRMLVEKNHFGQTESVLTYYMDHVMEEKNIGVADVTTAVALTEQQKNAVEKRLLETTRYVSFHMNYHVDADLIGGMIIRIGDRVVDSSIATKLANLQSDLSKIQLKVGESAS